MPPEVATVLGIAEQARSKREENLREEARGKTEENFVEHARSALGFDKAKKSLERRRQALRGELENDNGETRSRQIDDVMRVELKSIKEDPTFVNTRLYEDAFRPDLSSNEGQKLEDLEKSLKEDGQKTPIVVVPGPAGVFFLRAGFRRCKCARKLGWKTIVAIVLPNDISGEDEYWTNILENTTRKVLTTYEMANAARLMRDKFGVEPENFARRTGYSNSHVNKLLCCIDNLPDELKESWMMGAGLSFDEWYKLSMLEPEHAIKYFRRWTGLPAKNPLERLQLQKGKRTLAPPQWLDRMQKLYAGLEGSNLPPRTRDLCLKVIEFCMGSIKEIPGVYEPRKQHEYDRRTKLRAELAMPEPPDVGEEREIPIPTFDD